MPRIVVGIPQLQIFAVVKHRLESIYRIQLLCEYPLTFDLLCHFAHFGEKSLLLFTLFLGTDNSIDGFCFFGSNLPLRNNRSVSNNVRFKDRRGGFTNLGIGVVGAWSSTKVVGSVPIESWMLAANGGRWSCGSSGCGWKEIHLSIKLATFDRVDTLADGSLGFKLSGNF